MTGNELLNELKEMTPAQLEEEVELMVWEYNDNKADGHESRSTTHVTVSDDGKITIWSP